MKRNKRTKLALQPETIRHLASGQLRKAKGGVITTFDTIGTCWSEIGCGPEPTEHICESGQGQVCHTDWASCDTNYFGCPGTYMC